MYTSDDEDLSTQDGDICGDYDASDPPRHWTLQDIDEVLPIWWIRDEDCNALLEGSVSSR